MEDKTKLKKGKFRYASKAFFMKRSDFVRSRWSRASRYGNLTNRFGDAKVGRAYNFKHTLSNFLMWKLGLSRHDLNAQIHSSRMISNQFVGSCATWLLNRLSFVLLVSGFCANTSIANRIITQNQVLVNGVPVTDVNYQVQPGDFITVTKPLQYTQPEYSVYLTPNCLQTNWKLRSMVVIKSLSLVSSISTLYLNQLHVNGKQAKKVGSLMDPLTSILLRFESLFGQ